MRWVDGRVSVEDTVSAPHRVAGRALRDSFLPGMAALTFGLIRARGRALALGPWDLLRFGVPKTTGSAVEWPIDGGLLAGAPGGTWRLQSSGGRLKATATRYRPRLPGLVYAASQLPIHHALTRLYLLRLRGREPAPGPTATSADRLRAAAIDLALCASLAAVATRRRPRLRIMLGIAVAYHVACWTISGRTLGGAVMRQKVVAIDGSRLTPAQALLRFAALPLSWVRGRPDHDEISCSEVISLEP
ncbi:MAG TPA: RDD family protein [Candidatus Sulfotelmatobacter sp.]|nr:RDD family protein [Candidatus Sulfotelmatobacter sp.]